MQKKKQKVKFFQIAVDPPPPLKCKLFDKNFFKKNLVSQKIFCCSQNIPKHILVLKKSILKPLFTVYRLFFKCKLWLTPFPPFGKISHFGFFLHPSLMLLLKVTNVTNGHQKLPKMGQNSLITSFFAQRAKKSLSRRPKPSAGARIRPAWRAVSSS